MDCSKSPSFVITLVDVASKCSSKSPTQTKDFHNVDSGRVALVLWNVVVCC